MNIIAPPHFPGGTVPQRLSQVEKSLIRLVDELNMIIPMLENRKGDTL